MLRKGSVLNEHFSSSGPKEGRSQKLGLTFFCSDIGCLKPTEVNLLVPWTPDFSYRAEECGRSWEGPRPTVCTCNLADTMWHMGLIICFNVDLLTMVSWNAVLRILTRLSKCFSWLGMSRGEGRKEWWVIPVFPGHCHHCLNIWC